MERSSCKGRGGFFIESEPFYISRGPLQRFLRFFRALGSLTFSLSLRYATRLANIHNFRSLETHFISNRKSFFTSVFLEFQRVCDLTVSNLIFFWRILSGMLSYLLSGTSPLHLRRFLVYTYLRHLT